MRIIRPGLAADPEFLTRFRHEVAAARKVDCRYTALVVDADVDGPRISLRLRWLTGCARMARCRLRRP